MRLKEHIIASAALGALLYRRDWRRAALTAAAGVLVDLDHIALYVARSGDLSPGGALRYNRWRHQRPVPGDNRPRFGSLRSVLHRPALTLPLLWLPALRYHWLRPIAAGATLHLLLDLQALNLDLRVWWRAAGRCQGCGVAGLHREIYQIAATRHGGAPHAAANRAALCRPCALTLYARHDARDRRG